MKLLVVCQYYEPEPVRITDICETLVQRGHEVEVITGVPNYPMGTIYDGYRKGERRHETINGVKIHRCFTIGRRTGVLFRFLNYLSYAASSSWYVRKLESDFDVVLVNQLSPVTMACAGVRYKKLHGKKLVYYCLDLWPESLIAGGIKRGGVIYRVFNRISESLYRQADRILVTSKNFLPYFESQFGMKGEKMGYLPQYAEDMFQPCEMDEKQTVDLTFAGNIGAAQSVETIIKAASLLQNVENLNFHIVGDGSDLERCKALARELGTENVIFHGRKQLEEMPEIYRNSDAMLVTLSDDPLISRTLPGKVQTYMAAGKPIIGAINGETAEIIAQAECGLCGPAEDAKTLAENIRLFLQSDQRAQGKKARKFYEKHFTKAAFIAQLEDTLSD